MLRLEARVDLGALAMKEYSAFLKAPALLEPHQRIALCHKQDTRSGEGSYSSTEKQSVYSTVPADWVNVYSSIMTDFNGMSNCLNLFYA